MSVELVPALSVAIKAVPKFSFVRWVLAVPSSAIVCPLPDSPEGRLVRFAPEIAGKAPAPVN